MYGLNKHIRTIAGALACLLVLATIPARAEDTPPDPRGWYVGGSLGAVWAGGLTDQPFTVSANGVTASARQGFTLKSGPSAALQGGYQWERHRLEAEFLYQSFGRNDSTFTLVQPGSTRSVSEAGSDIRTYSLFVNGYYDFKTKSRVRPYLGAGIGLTRLNAGVISTDLGVIRTAGLDQTAFGYQFKAGLSYDMSASAAAFLQYRFAGATGFHYGGATGTVGGEPFSVPRKDGTLSNSTVELGLRWRL